MATFHYQALNAQRQIVIGDLQADSVAQALVQLEEQGLIVQSIGYASENAAAPISAELASGIAAATSRPPGESPFAADAEQAVLRSHLARVLQRSQAMLPALRAFTEEMPQGRRRRQWETVLQVLQRGDVTEATGALARLPDYWIPLLSAAATSHDPGRVFREFLEESQQAADLQRQWWHAIAYPLLIVGLAGVVLTALSFIVVPTFRDIFVEFDIPLPRPTIVVLTVAAWITSGWALIHIGLVVLVVYLLVKATQWFPSVQQSWIGDSFGAPLGRNTALARVSRFAADLLEAGLDPPTALRIAGSSSRSPRLQSAAWRTAWEIERNEGLPPQSRCEPLTQTIVHAIRADMTPEARIRVLRTVSDCHAERARLRLSWTRGLVEPLAICVIGTVVGATVLALFLPLLNLIHALSG